MRADSSSVICVPFTIIMSSVNSVDPVVANGSDVVPAETEDDDDDDVGAPTAD